MAILFALSGAACAATTSAVDAGPSDSARVIDATDAIDAIDAVDVIVVGPADAGLCGDAACSSGEICIRGRCAGCCDLPPQCVPIPPGCSGPLACGCFASDPCGGCTRCGSVEADGIHCVNCQCMCAAPGTPISTPDGDRPIASLRVGDLVDSIDHGRRVAVPVLRVNRTPVSHHVVVRVVLDSGLALHVSAGHPTADGRTFGALRAGDWLGGRQVEGVSCEAYADDATYDILPASDTGAYFAGGALIGSTLADVEAQTVEAAPLCPLAVRLSAPERFASMGLR